MSLPRPRRADAQRNRDRIVAATQELLAARLNPTMQDVADAAGVGIATVYRSFPRRETLLGEAHARDMCDRIAPYVDRLMDSGDTIEALMSLSSAIVTVAVEQSDDLAAHAGATALFIDMYAERFGPAIREVMLRAQRDGLLRPDLDEADILGVTRFFIGGLAQPGQSATTAKRYISLWFDAVTPGPPRPLPPVAR